MKKRIAKKLIKAQTNNVGNPLNVHIKWINKDKSFRVMQYDGQVKRIFSITKLNNPRK